MAEPAAAELVIGEGWDPVKVTEHVADLCRLRDQEEAIYGAMTDAAEEHLRAQYALDAQIAHCRETFSKPRRPPVVGG